MMFRAPPRMCFNEPPEARDQKFFAPPHWENQA